ncbi:MAG: hypothetical protein IT310_09770 [Anaerolineales bacterium]|nr:hypothetical protein [Anaerolineales bacterium]
MPQDDHPNSVPLDASLYFKNMSQQEILNAILSRLKSAKPSTQLEGLRLLHGIRYSSVAIRQRVEALAVDSDDSQVQKEALETLGLETHQAVQRSANLAKLNQEVRKILLGEISAWVMGGVINSKVADVLRRRYDFDLVAPAKPQPAPQPSAKPAPTAESAPAQPPQPVEISTPTEDAQAAQILQPEPIQTPQPAQVQVPQPKPVRSVQPAKIPAPAPKPREPEGPRPTLLQTLTSEASIKIYLYLGAFFVIAAAAILGAAVPGARLPILIIGTLIFGGLAVAIKKRLPQPSFALFIVFSFLLPITGNSLEESLRSALNYSADGTTFIWTILFLLMALFWSGGVYLYQSRLFSVTAFGALLLSAYSLAKLLATEPELYTLTLALATLLGWVGVRFLRKWQDAKFALPLFISTQAVQAIVLLASISIFSAKLVNGSASSPTWHLVSLGVWILASLFYALSAQTEPKFIFEWLSTAALIPLPWFIIAAFNLQALGSSLVFFLWGAILTVASEGFWRFKFATKFSLPFLLAGLFTLASSSVAALGHKAWLVLLVTAGSGAILTALHVLRTRWPLWTLALLNFIIAYFAFFNLEFIRALIPGSYQVFLVSLLLLLPDLFLKKDWRDLASWRIPMRAYGILLAACAYLYTITVAVAGEYNASLDAAVIFAVYAGFTGVYALAYRTAWLGYVSTATLPLAFIFIFNHFNLNAWLPTLTVLAIFYFLLGLAIHARANWSLMLRNSALILGALVSLTALVLLKPHSGWYVLVIGLLFVAEMYLYKNSLFEMGAPVFFTIGAFLVLRDFNVTRITIHLLIYSLIWLSADLIAHLAYKHPRLLSAGIRFIGGSLALINYLLLLGAPSGSAAISFAIYTAFTGVYALAYRRAWLGYIPAATLPLAFIFTFNHFKLDAWLPTLTVLSILYFLLGLAIQFRASWSFMLRNSALILGALISLNSLIFLKEHGGWYVLVIGLLFVAEMLLRKNGLFEAGAPTFFTIGAFLILNDFKVAQATIHLLIYSLIWLSADLIAHLAFKHPRPLSAIIRVIGGSLTLINYLLLLGASSGSAAISFAIYTAFTGVYALAYRRAWLGYIPAATLPLAFIFTFNYFKLDAWLPVLTILSIFYLLLGLAIRSRTNWSLMLRNSALILGALISLSSLALLKETSGWYIFVISLLFVAEMFLRKNGLFEVGAPTLFSIGAFLVLRDFKVTQISMHLLAYSLIWLSADLLAHLTFKHPRPLRIPLRALGGLLALINYFFLFGASNGLATFGFAAYTLFFLTYSLLYKNPTLFYAFTLTLPIFSAFLFRLIGFNKWIHPVAIIALAHYAAGYLVQKQTRLAQWGLTLMRSGLGLGVLVSCAAPFFTGADVAIPVAIAATLWAAEAFTKKNVYLAFPANGLYLWSYFILLYKLNVTQPQFFSIGAALLGLFQHYLLTRAGSKAGAFIMGMLSQFILIGTSYVQMVQQNQLIYFFALFIQSITVLGYGIIVRSRSLTFFPIGFVIIAVITVVLGQLQGIATILLVGCAGVVLLTLGVVAVLLRERIAALGEKLSSWQA